MSSCCWCWCRGHLALFGITFSGAMGAATATLTARTLYAIGLLIYVLTLKEAKPFGLLDRAGAPIVPGRSNSAMSAMPRCCLFHRGRRLCRHDPVCRTRR
ncbi:MAG: hypothetical protein WDN06_18280 [Asticcacaulis sp.]